MVYVLDAFKPLIQEMVDAKPVPGYTPYVMGVTLREITEDDRAYLTEAPEQCFVIQVEVTYDPDDETIEDLITGTFIVAMSGDINEPSSFEWN